MPAGKADGSGQCGAERRAYFFTPSTHNSVLTMVPVTFEAAATCTGELTEEPRAGSTNTHPGRSWARCKPHLRHHWTVAFTALSHF